MTFYGILPPCREPGHVYVVICCFWNRKLGLMSKLEHLPFTSKCIDIPVQRRTAAGARVHVRRPSAKPSLLFGTVEPRRGNCIIYGLKTNCIHEYAWIFFL